MCIYHQDSAEQLRGLFDGGAVMTNGASSSTWENKTPEEILADLERILADSLLTALREVNHGSNT